jgi:hypothetical protein
MYFVKNRGFKHLICQKEGLDFMIDDRLDILQTIKKTKTMLFRAQNHKSNNGNNFKPDYTADSWEKAVQYINSANPINNSAGKSNHRLDVAEFCHLII